ncbi:hypothetical protein CPB83DRAFT_302907 [Crepidotus variabilis]|uniref:Uncharacterized protein n=1 Tax=Crepidotus variabilis TaxID=179855 RepID=A0A9P6EGY6_9AGAR|nr:hypothetical protein CPB83DRAFT_302907 [Crepidotus variabilis]
MTHVLIRCKDIESLKKPKAPAIRVPPKTDSQIYHDQLLYKGRGAPLWLPGPNLRLPKAYRLEGVRIGDVGIINESGGFSFLFNIFEHKDSEINRGKVPGGFEPLEWRNGSDSRLNTAGVDSDDVEEYSVYGDASWLGSREITQIDSPSSSGFTFKMGGPEGAILTMPDGASSKDLVNRQALKDYMTSNLEEWYKYVNHQRGREAKNGDLRLVYGCDKVASWGIGTFRDDENNYKSTQEIKMHFNAIRQQPYGTAGTPRRYVWKCAGGGSGRAGPAEREVKDLISRPDPMSMDIDGESQSHADAQIENQCVFVRTFNAMLSESIWESVITNPGATSDTGENPEDETHRKSERQNDSSGFRREGHRPADSSEDNHASRGTFSGVQYMASVGEPSVIPHPSSLLNQFLLDQFPGAKMAITEDADWIAAHNTVSR